MESVARTFLRLLEESVIVQSTVTLIAVGVTSYMVIKQVPVPKEFWTMNGIIIGFWFGSKTQIAEKTARKSEQKAMTEMMKVAKGD
jgi:arginine exporter protein ArgO